jgi:SecD/SecF fusion protein
VEARHGIDQYDYPIVTMVMNDQGTRKWQQITKEESSKTPKGYLAVVLDNLVYSHPLVNSEIRGGRTEISGGFTLEEAEDFALMLSVGQLPPLRVISIEDVNIPESKAKR